MNVLKITCNKLLLLYNKFKGKNVQSRSVESNAAPIVINTVSHTAK